MNKIITIGREFGSGGRELGKRLAEQLCYAYYDQEIIMEIVNRTELSESYVRQIIERKPLMSYPIHIGRSFQPVMNYHTSQNQNIFKEQRQIIREMSEKSNCVIVGRCADYILKDSNPFRIFVYADIESKIDRCRQKASKQENLTDKQLKQQIQSVDKHRAGYYKLCTGNKWDDRRNYDLCINTTNMEIKTIVQMIAKMFE